MLEYEHTGITRLGKRKTVVGKTNEVGTRRGKDESKPKRRLDSSYRLLSTFVAHNTWANPISRRFYSEMCNFAKLGGLPEGPELTEVPCNIQHNHK